jgi:Domain of unknown function (DUF4286)/Protein of unknown function (DUF3667)
VTPDDDNETVLYEVNLEAEAGVEGEFDTWLRDHIADVLQFDGFLSAEILDDASPAAAGRIRRTVQYRLRNQAALDTYLREHAPRMQQQGVARFGDRYSAARRTLAHREEFIRGAFSTENCLNCGEVLRGQHCSHCGQRAKVRVLSLGTLLRDLFGDLTNFDSRIWRTLRPLAFSPGMLTVDYLRGRRTHYSPPFRMYLILSVAFFLLTSVSANDPGDLLKFDVGNDGSGGANVTVGPSSADAPPTPDTPDAGTAPPADPAAAAQSPPGGASSPALDAERRRLLEQIIRFIPAKDQARARQEIERELGGMTAAQIEPIKQLADDPCGPENLKIGFDENGRAMEAKARAACRKIVSDGKGFGRAVYENVPKMMFIFLPLIALVMLVLYLGSGRYYVEHLLFFVHYHSFFFLAGIFILLLDNLATWFAGTRAESAFDVAEGILGVGLFVYVPYYLYRAMRRVYGQGRGVTLVKYGLLGIGYLFFMTLTVLGLVAYTALTL